MRNNTSVITRLICTTFVLLIICVPCLAVGRSEIGTSKADKQLEAYFREQTKKLIGQQNITTLKR